MSIAEYFNIIIDPIKEVLTFMHQIFIPLNGLSMKRYILFLTLMFLIINTYGQHSKDSVAIRLLLERESATWRSGDIKAHADCWHIQPYSRILVSTADGTILDIPPDVMIHPPVNSVGKGGTSVNSNYKMSIKGNNAWVSHNEESTAEDGTKTYSLEIRMLERIHGQWKLVGQSIHIYKPK